jgi:hypothetical protein
MDPIAVAAAVCLTLWLYKLTHLVPAAWYDTECSARNGTLAEEGWSWRQHFVVAVAVAALMALVLLPIMLWHERWNFFRPYDRTIIRRVADEAAAERDREGL